MEAPSPTASASSAPIRSILNLGSRAAIGLTAIICAFLAEHPSDPMQVPVWVVAVSLLAIIGAAIAMPDPFPAKTRHVECVEEDRRTIVLGSAALILPTVIAVFVWLQEPFQDNHLFINASSSWAAVL